MLIDTHAHIFSYHFEDDLDEIIDRCKKEGIKKIFMPNIDSGSVESMIAVENKYKGYCESMMGLHPCSVKENYLDELKIVEKWLKKRKFSAIGEMGTDLYWDKAFIKEQEKAFDYQVGLALEHDLPVVIHCRESIDLTIDLVKEKQNGRLSGVFHCFTGDAVQAERIVDLGFYLGIGGVVTFKNGGLDHVIKDISLDHLVLETDSPYLSPTPMRGKRNEPSYLRYIADKLAEVKSVDRKTVQEITGRNALKLYRQ